MTDEISKDHRIADLEAEVRRLRGLSAPVADLMQELDLAKGEMERMRSGAHEVGRISMAAVSREKAMRDRAEAAEATLAKVAALAEPGTTPDGEPLPEWVHVDDLRAVLTSAGRHSDGEDARDGHAVSLLMQASARLSEAEDGLARVEALAERLDFSTEPGPKVANAIRGAIKRPASPVVAPSATDEDGA